MLEAQQEYNSGKERSKQKLTQKLCEMGLEALMCNCSVGDRILMDQSCYI